MRGLEILEQVQDYVGWELHGESGISLICDGKAVNADLRQPDFEITADTTRLICSSINHWLQQQARKGEMEGLEILGGGGGEAGYVYWELHGIDGRSRLSDTGAATARFNKFDSPLPDDQVKRIIEAVNKWLGE
jgi:hypothetical protein